MKRTLIFVLLLWVSTSNLQAQTNREKVVELFKLMQLDKTMDGVLDNMTTMMTKQNADLKNANGDPTFTEYMAYVKEETKAFSKKMINEDMVNIYTKYFTNEDIKNFTQFYSSPSGKKMIELTPTFQKELMTSMMTTEMPLLQAKFKKKLEELKAKK